MDRNGVCGFTTEGYFLIIDDATSNHCNPWRIILKIVKEGGDQERWGIGNSWYEDHMPYEFWGNSMHSLTLDQGWGNHLQELERSSFSNKEMLTLVRMFWFDQEWWSDWSLVGKLLGRLRKCGIARWSVSLEMGFEISNAQTINRELSSPFLLPFMYPSLLPFFPSSSPTPFSAFLLSQHVNSQLWLQLHATMSSCMFLIIRGRDSNHLHLWASKNALFHMLSWSW